MTNWIFSGDSAGGNLAAAVSLKLRDDKFKPMPKVQILIYPALQLLNLNTPSYQYNSNALVLSKRVTAEFASNYVFGHWDYVSQLLVNGHTSPGIKKQLQEKYLKLDALPDDELRTNYQPQSINRGNETFWKEHERMLINPYLNPLIAEDLRGLPPAYLSSCKYDPLRDDSYFYTKRLRDAKVKVEHVALNTCMHGWILMHSQIDQFDWYFRDIIESIGTYI